MPRVAKQEIMQEEKETELGFMGVSDRRGKTVWYVVYKVVGVTSGRLYNHVEALDGNEQKLEFSSKSNAAAFVKGYNYRLNEEGETPTGE